MTEARTLGTAAVQEARQERAYKSHVAPLNAWAASLAIGGGGREVPLFDPDDGGIGARVLLLLESPGPAVSTSKFISMDNPDGTAENILGLVERQLWTGENRRSSTRRSVRHEIPRVSRRRAAGHPA